MEDEARNAAFVAEHRGQVPVGEEIGQPPGPAVHIGQRADQADTMAVVGVTAAVGGAEGLDRIMGAPVPAVDGPPDRFATRADW